MQQGDAPEGYFGRRSAWRRPHDPPVWPFASRPADKPAGQAGFSLLYVIVAVVLLSSVAAAVTALTPRAWVASVANTAGQRAYYMALSGLQFWSRGVSGRYVLGEDSFSLSASDPDATGYVTVSSLGRAMQGSPLEANVVLTARRWGLAPITFANDLGDFVLPGAAQAPAAPPITIYAAAPKAASGATSGATAAPAEYAGGWVRLGNPAGDTGGAVWYGGDHGTCSGGVCPEGMCAAGRCSLGQGLRAVFGFACAHAETSPTSEAYGDGFTFAVMTAANDPATAVGGGKGEYLGYAGPGVLGVGIAPPKLAVEVDMFPNHRATDPAMTNSRNDQSDANHVAVLAWGSTVSNLDDNVHGAGDAPQNPAGGSGGYASSPAEVGWLEDGGEHTLRVEIHRTVEAGQGVYRVLVWIDPAGSGAGDVTRDYAAEVPRLDQTLRLDAAAHAGLETAYFGFTEAFGAKKAPDGSVQTVALHDFSLDFRR